MCWFLMLIDLLDNCGVLEELMESIAGMQSRRMDEQRASLPQLPGLNNQHAILQRLSVAASDSTPLPDDNFFDMLMRCQVRETLSIGVDVSFLGYTNTNVLQVFYY